MYKLFLYITITYLCTYIKYKYFCQYNTIMYNMLVIYYSFKCNNIYNQIHFNSHIKLGIPYTTYI